MNKPLKCTDLNCWCQDNDEYAPLPATASREALYGDMVDAAAAEAEAVIPSTRQRIATAKPGEYVVIDRPESIESLLDLPAPLANMLPEDDNARGNFPMFDGLMAYFPNALAEVSLVSKIGNDQHNPGQPMHWARDKSRDHENKILRHLTDSGNRDARGVRHTARLAWRALAMLQEEIELQDGLPPSRASRNRPF